MSIVINDSQIQSMYFAVWKHFLKVKVQTLKFWFLLLFIVDNHKNRKNRFWIGIWLECFLLIAFFNLNHINVVSDKVGESMCCDESKEIGDICIKGKIPLSRTRQYSSKKCNFDIVYPVNIFKEIYFIKITLLLYFVLESKKIGNCNLNKIALD